MSILSFSSQRSLGQDASDVYLHALQCHQSTLPPASHPPLFISLVHSSSLLLPGEVLRRLVCHIQTWIGSVRQCPCISSSWSHRPMSSVPVLTTWQGIVDRHLLLWRLLQPEDEKVSQGALTTVSLIAESCA